MVGIPFQRISDDRDAPVSEHLSREDRSPEPVESDRSPGRPSTAHRGSDAGSVKGNPLPQAVAASAPGAPQTYVIDGGLFLPEGEYLVTVYDDGVTLAWRGDHDHATVWMPPVEGLRS